VFQFGRRGRDDTTWSIFSIAISFIETQLAWRHRLQQWNESSRMQSLLILLLNAAILRVSAIQSFLHQSKDDDWGRINDASDGETEEIYGLTPEEYQQYVVPEQYIIGLNGETVSNATTYIQNILQKGSFVNATALWHYQTTTLTGVTIAGMDDQLYTVIQSDPNVIFIEPVSSSDGVLKIIQFR
jgi:hypothetical protein